MKVDAHALSGMHAAPFLCKCSLAGQDLQTAQSGKDRPGGMAGGRECEAELVGSLHFCYLLVLLKRGKVAPVGAEDPPDQVERFLQVLVGVICRRMAHMHARLHRETT